MSTRRPAVAVLGAMVALSVCLGAGVLGPVDAASTRGEGDRWILEALLEPDPGPPASQLGVAVAVSGKRAAVGNRRNPDLGTDTGQVHCFDLVRKAWRPTPLVKEPSGCLTCDFGAALALDADRLLVGAPRDGALGFEAGRAHVFLRRGTKWVLESTLARPTPAPAELFGQAVALAGRVAVTGAPYADGASGAPNESTPDCGAAEIFELRDGRWTHAATLRPPEPATSGWFGAAVAAEGDLVAVGAYGQPDGAASAGAVHLYRRIADGWVHEQSIRPPWPGPAWFGLALSINEGRLLVGAPRAQTPGASAATGAAFLYERRIGSPDRPGEFELSAALSAPWLEAGDALGISVALERDAAFVGASGDDEEGADAGAVHLFTRSGSIFRPAERISIPGLAAGDHAGAALAIARGRLLVGRGGDPEVEARPGDGRAWMFSAPALQSPARTSSTAGSTRPAPPRHSQTRGRSRRAIAAASRTG